MRRPAFAVTVLALAISACTGGIEESTEALETPSATPTASATVSPSDGSDRSIVVRAPRPGDDVFSPVVVTGTASTASGEVLVRVLARDGTELAAVDASIDCGTACRGSFRTQLVFFWPSRQRGLVQVLELEPDGSARHLVEIPVTLVPGV